MNFFFAVCLAIVLAFLGGYELAKHELEKNFMKKIRMEEKKSARYLLDMRIDLLMIQRYMSGIEFDKMLKAHNYKRVAIYGSANVGKCLYYFLNSSEIEIVCFIDKRNSVELLYDIPVYDLSNIDVSIDAIIVTPLTYFDEIFNDLKTKINCPIIPVTDIFGDE